MCSMSHRAPPCVIVLFVSRKTRSTRLRIGVFYGAHYENVRESSASGLREAKMREVWIAFFSGKDPDRGLSLILGDARAPSARDWYVATSVIQWLATNVGMALLEAAGFRHHCAKGDKSEAVSGV